MLSVKRLCLYVIVANINIVERVYFHTKPKDHSTHLKEVTDSASFTNSKKNLLKCYCGYFTACFDRLPCYAYGKLSACF